MKLSPQRPPTIRRSGHWNAVAVCLLLVGALAGCQQWEQFTAARQPAPNASVEDASAALSSPKTSPSAPQRPSLAKALRRTRPGRHKEGVSFEWARSLEQSGQLDRAASAYLEVAKTEPNHPAVYHRLAVVHVQLGQPAVAQQYFQKALLQDSMRPELLCDFGYSLYLAGDLDGAETQFRAALAQQPNYPQAHLHLGLVQARHGKTADALASFQAAGCDPTKAQANVAYAHMLERRYADAAHQLNGALADHPNSKTLRNRLKEVQAILARSEVPASTVAPAGYDALPESKGVSATTRAHISD